MRATEPEGHAGDDADLGLTDSILPFDRPWSRVGLGMAGIGMP
jgi:hypothetical protein